MLPLGLMLAPGAQEFRSERAFDFSRSPVVYIDTEEGRCLYFFTDGGENYAGFARTLSKLDKARGIEVLTSPSTASRCVARAVKKLKQARIMHQVRPARADDPDLFPPPPICSDDRPPELSPRGYLGCRRS